MNSDSEGRLLGDYLLKQVFSKNPATTTWLAEQVSIRRPVLVEILESGSAESFLADIRAKAALNYPIFSAVYEAVSKDGLCFFASEHLPGKTVADLLAEGASLSPAALVRGLERIAASQMHLEAQNIAASPMEAGKLYFNDYGSFRLENPALAGARDPSRSIGDIAFLGALLPTLVSNGQPAANRLLNVLGWMRGEDAPVPVGWAQVQDYCSQIERQLAVVKDRPARAKWMMPVLPVIAFSLMATAFFWNPSGKKRTASTDSPGLSEPVEVATGSYTGPDEDEETLAAFRISAQPVTVSEYRAFLETLTVLSENRLERTFDHRDQPAAKENHEPSSWHTLLLGPPDAPVTGVDWWDASAYATWKKGRLPSQQQWFAARPSTEISSVLEWTSSRAPNPANPLGEAHWIIARPTTPDPSREWTPDRSLRRANIGFRVVWEKK